MNSSKILSHSTLVLLLTFSLTLVGTVVNAQCNDIIGSDGAPTSSPVWSSCEAGELTLYISTNSFWDGLTVDWGDNTETESFEAWSIVEDLSHTYADEYAEYLIVFTGIDGCEITGQFIRREALSTSLSGPEHVCEGFPATIMHTDSQADSYLWNFNGGQGTWYPGAAPNLNLTFNDSGTYEVQGVVALDGFPATCSDTAVFYVSVTPVPDAIISLTADEACGTLVTIAQELSGEGNEYEWTFNTPPFSYTGSTSNEIIFDTPGMHLIQLEVTDELGCVSNDTEIVTVYQSPNVEFSVEGVCEGNISSFSNYSNSSENDTIVSTQWSFGDGNVSNEQNPQHNYLSAGDFEVTLEISTSHCTSSISHLAIVDVMPEISATSDTNGGCSPLTVNFESVCSENATITWDFGDNQSSNSPVNQHIYLTESIDTNGTIFEVIATATSPVGCIAMDTIEIVANISAVANFSSSNNGCSPLNTIFINNSENASEYSWSFSDGLNSSEINPVHTFENTSENTQTFPIELIAIAENGCNDITSMTLEVYPELVIDFTISQNEGCAPFEVITSSITNSDQITWSFGDGSNDSTLPSVSHIYLNESDNTQIFTLTSLGVSEYGCISESSSLITVNPQPTAQFLTNISEGCSPLVVSIIDSSTQALDLNWSYGDGATDSGYEGEMHQYNFQNFSNETIAHEIILTVIGDGGCVDTQNAIINVFPEVISQFSIPQASCAPFTTLFTNNGSENGIYNWEFGDGDSSDEENPSHTFLNPSSTEDATFDVTLTVSSENGCTSVSTEVITSLATPAANIAMTQMEGCGSFYATASETNGDGENYFWTFDTAPFSHNGNTTPEVLFHTTGSHEIELEVIATNGCSVEIFETVQVFEIPTSDFNVEDVCHGELTLFSDDSSTEGVDDIIEWNWIFGDGGVSNEQNPSVMYSSAGTYAVELEVSTVNCSSVINSVTYVEQIPTVLLSTNITSGCSPLTINFEANSNDNATIYWDFGDDQGSENINEVHTYLNENVDVNGTIFIVTATAVSPLGCVAVDTTEIQALKGVNASITSSGNGCAPLNTFFTNDSENASDFTWNFSNGNSSNEFEPIQTFENISEELQTITVDLMAISENGCNDSTSITVDVFPEMLAQFNSPQADCSPFEVEFSNESSSNASYEWIFGDGDFSENENPVHIFSTQPDGDDAIFMVELTVTSEFGCIKNTSSEISVLATPIADFNVTPITQIFPDATVEIETLSSFGSSSTVLWNFGDGNINTIFNPEMHTYNTWGEYSISLNISNEYCSDNLEETITILSPMPNLDFTGGGEGCAPFTVEFTNQSQYANTYKWHLGDGTTILSENVTHTFTNAGTYDITLEAMSVDGDLVVETHYASVTVYPRAQSDFTLFPNEVFIPGEPIDFYNLSTNADEFIWYFGNGETSTDENPTYEYTTSGNYNVTLTANNEWGCSSTYTIEDAVTAKEGGLIVFPTAFTPLSGGGNGGTYDLQSYDNDVFRPLHGGVLDYEVFVFNKFGEQIFYSADINIGWDGYVYGSLATQDVYAYKAVANLSDGTRVEKAGTVTLISK